MSRDGKGRFVKGSSGNLKGRPPRKPRIISRAGIRDEFMEASNMLVSMTDSDGKRKKIPASLAIYKQLVMKAVQGNLWAIREYTRQRHQHVTEYMDEQIKLLEEYLEGQRICRDNPEDVSEKFLQALRRIRAMLGPGFEPD